MRHSSGTEHDSIYPYVEHAGRAAADCFSHNICHVRCLGSCWLGIRLVGSETCITSRCDSSGAQAKAFP